MPKTIIPRMFAIIPGLSGALFFAGMAFYYTAEESSVPEEQEIPVSSFAQGIDTIRLDPYLTYLEETDGPLNIEEAYNRLDRFQYLPARRGKLGFIQNPIWVHFTLETTEQSEGKSWLLEIPHTPLDSIEFYYPVESENEEFLLHNDGEDDSIAELSIARRSYQITRAGRIHPFEERLFPHRSNIFPLPELISASLLDSESVGTNEPVHYFLRIQTSGIMNASMYLWEPTAFHKHDRNHEKIRGIYFGFFFALILINLLLYYYLRNPSVMSFSIFLLFFVIFIALATGTFTELPGFHHIVEPLTMFVLGILYISALIFARQALMLKRHAHRLDYALFMLMIPAALLSLGAPLPTVPGSFFMRMALLLAINFVILLAGVYSFWRQAHFSIYFINGWLWFISGITVATLTYSGALPETTFTARAFYPGSSIGAMILTIGLASRINRVRIAHTTVRNKLLRNFYRLYRMKQEFNQVLEEKINERTEDLEIVNEQLLSRTKELEQTNQRLKDTQGHLIQAEKMVSLGTMVAGIAHEINNPLNYIRGYLDALRKNSEQSIAFFRERLEPLLEVIDDADTHDAIIEEMEQYKVFDMIEMLPTVLRRTTAGVERISDIVSALKSFSRPDGELKENTDVHACIEGAMYIIPPRLLSGMEIERNYDTLPEIRGYPGQLKQVFLNIVLNSMQAMNGKGKVQIKTEYQGDWIQIKLSDEGPGIDPELKDKIFDPFFTTKKQGEGTGLGLAISYTIISRHGGKIDVENLSEKGCVFTIDLPAEETGEPT